MDYGALRFSLIARGLAVGSAAGTLIATAWFFGATGRGAIAATTSVITIASLLVGFSLGRNLSYEIQAAQAGSNSYIAYNLSAICKLVGLIAIVTCLLVGIICVTIQDRFGELKWYHLSVGMLWIPYYVWAQFAENIYAGMGEIRSFNVWQTTTSTVMLAFAFAGGWLLQDSLLLFMSAYGALLLVCTLIEVLWVYKKFAVHGHDSYRLGSSLRSASVLHVDTVGALMFANAGTLFINRAVGFAGVGAYDLAGKLSAVWSLMAVAVRGNLLASASKDGVGTTWRDNRRFVLGCLLGVAVVACVAGNLVGWVIERHFSGFAGWTAYFLMFSSVTILSSLPTMVTPLMIARGWAKLIAFGTLLFGIINMTLMWIWTPMYGVMGTLMALWLTYFIAFVGNVYMMERSSL